MDLINTTLFEGRFVTALPSGLTDLPELLLRKKYPLEGRPQIVKTDEAYTTDYKFTLMEIGTNQYAVNELSGYMKDTLFRSNCSYRFIEDMIVEDEKNFAAKGFSFSNPVLDGTAYNLIFLKQFGTLVMNLSFSCPFEKSDSLSEGFKLCVKNMQMCRKGS